MYVGFGLLGYIDYGPSPSLTLFSGLAVLLLAPEFFQPLRTLSQHYHDRAAALGAAESIVTILDEPDVVPTRFEVYRKESQKVRDVFNRYTELVEPLSLDEAYLDVTGNGESGVSIASQIRKRIEEETGLTASAGIAPNKLLAKIASDWKKPNGQFEIKPGEVEEFLEHLPVRRLHGVGRKTEERLASVDVLTCGDLQRISKFELADLFGSWGLELYALCRGIDNRPVRIDRIRKSVSSERTLKVDVEDFLSLVDIMEELRIGVKRRINTRVYTSRG